MEGERDAKQRHLAAPATQFGAPKHWQELKRAHLAVAGTTTMAFCCCWHQLGRSDQEKVHCSNKYYLLQARKIAATKLQEPSGAGGSMDYFMQMQMQRTTLRENCRS